MASMSAKDIVSETTGWVIVHPDNQVEMDYFGTHRYLNDEKMEQYRPGCTRIKVKLVPIEDKLTQIHVFNNRDRVHMTVYTAPEEAVWFPEIAYDGYNHPLPRPPREIINETPTYVGKCIFTMSEYIVLWFLREIREGRMAPEEVQLFCNLEPIEINANGELIDEWPDGFFCERAELLF